MTLDVVKQVASKQLGLDIKFPDSTIKIESDANSNAKDEVTKSETEKSTKENSSEIKDENE